MSSNSACCADQAQGEQLSTAAPVAAPFRKVRRLRGVMMKVCKACPRAQAERGLQMGIHPCSSGLHPKRTGIRSILAAKPPRVSLNLLQRQSVFAMKISNNHENESNCVRSNRCLGVGGYFS